MPIVFTALISLVVGVVVASWLTWRPMDRDLRTANQERRAAQARTADLQARSDRLGEDGVALRGLAADFYASWAAADADADEWWGRYTTASEIAHDYADRLSAATAHEAELVEDPDPIEDTPMLRELEASMPVSPAPVYDFAAPTGSWAFADIRPAIDARRAELTEVAA